VRHDLPKRWALLRRIYAEYADDLSAAAAENPRYSTDPYFVDWLPIFTPIEEAAWAAIRYRGLPFYPQFPALQYFLDFACPHLKIAVETDGKMHDPEKDRRRDTRLMEAGWKVFRVQGRECFRDFKTKGEMVDEHMPEDEQEEATEQWLKETCDGVFESIRIVYFSEGESPYWDWAVRSLAHHRLVDFAI
jgi:very-short-patch-repair endonuclease